MYVCNAIIAYCMSIVLSWGLASKSAMKPLMSLYKQAHKVFDMKPVNWHKCQIILKYHLLSFDHFLTFSFVKTIFICVNGLGPEVICQLIETYNNGGVRTRTGVSGNFRVQSCRTTLGQSLFSAKVSQVWNLRM